MRSAQRESTHDPHRYDQQDRAHRRMHITEERETSEYPASRSCALPLQRTEGHTCATPWPRPRIVAHNNSKSRARPGKRDRARPHTGEQERGGLGGPRLGHRVLERHKPSSRGGDMPTRPDGTEAVKSGDMPPSRHDGNKATQRHREAWHTSRTTCTRARPLRSCLAIDRAHRRQSGMGHPDCRKRPDQRLPTTTRAPLRARRNPMRNHHNAASGHMLGSGAMRRPAESRPTLGASWTSPKRRLRTF